EGGGRDLGSNGWRGAEGGRRSGRRNGGSLGGPAARGGRGHQCEGGTVEKLPARFRHASHCSEVGQAILPAPGFQPAGPAGKRVRSLNRLPQVKGIIEPRHSPVTPMASRELMESCRGPILQIGRRHKRRPRMNKTSTST